MLPKLFFVFVVCTTSVYNVNANTDEGDEIENNINSDGIIPVDPGIEDVQDTISELNESVSSVLTNVKKSISEVEENIQKWKAWRKHLDCSNTSENLVVCKLKNLSAKGNPDTWKRDSSNAEIPVKPPKGYESKEIPSKVNGALSDWLSKLQGILGASDSTL